MNMIDHLFLFPDEAVAHAALDPLGFGAEGSWDGSRVLPCRVVMGWELGSTVDPETDELMTFEVPVYMPGFQVNVALPDLRPDLAAMPECVLVTDREAAADEGATRADFVLHTKVSPETMDAVQEITPQFAGSRYPLGAG
ncbi:hypothetical protein [Enterovirga sp. CN4-39]|uniref:hypothetical protein n=1 Tax=Enterovirga sp. CN4-39 TaxID=3400910 RepID=UPI003C0AEF09